MTLMNPIWEYICQVSGYMHTTACLTNIFLIGLISDISVYFKTFRSNPTRTELNLVVPLSAFVSYHHVTAVTN